MASAVTIRRYLLVILLVCTVVFCCASGEDDYEPEIGAIGEHPSHEEGDEDHGHEGGGEYQGHEGGDEDEGHDGGGEEDHGHEGGGEDHGHEAGGEDHGHEAGGEDHGHEGGGEDHGHEGGDEDHGHESGGEDHGGLLCFHEKHIYNSCDESCRLSPNGDLHVSHDQADEFCNGPCLEETNRVLECLEGIMDRFLFYNQATTQDVRDTISAGCGHGDERGNFDVGEHIEDDEGGGSIGSEPKFSLLLSVTVIIVTLQILVL